MITRLARRQLSIGLLVLAAGCAAESSRATRNGASNELLIVGYDREPDTMNRYATHILEDIQSCVIEGLVTADEKMNIVPVLAAEIPTPENGGAEHDPVVTDGLARQILGNRDAAAMRLACIEQCREQCAVGLLRGFDSERRAGGA